jgi:hypothetical protein
MPQEIPTNDFRLSVGEASFFTKASAPEGQQRRIGGVVSTETPDRQEETLIQNGLDFSEFVKYGWFNDNHSNPKVSHTCNLVGYPELTERFQKGDRLPDGEIAKADCHWAEGYLLEGYPPADELWNLACALNKTPRRLGFSVEGKIQRRDPLNKSTVTKAIVREVAITKAPVNTDTQLNILAKALSMGTTIPGNSVDGDKTGENAGQVLAQESLEKKKKKNLKKGLTDSQAFAWLSNHLPNISPELKGRIISLTRDLKLQNKLH